MFISLSREFGKFRLGAGLRVTKKNAAYMIFVLMIYWMLLLCFYMVVFCFWLMYAVCYGLEKIIESLLKFGADVSLKSLNNFDALMLAKNNWTKHLLQKSLQTALEKQQNPKKIGIHPVRSQVNLTNSQKING